MSNVKRDTKGESPPRERSDRFSKEATWSPSLIGERVASNTARLLPKRSPETPLQALMETAPHEEPETDKVSLLPLREAIADAFDLLDPELREVAEAWLIERSPLRDLSKPNTVGPDDNALSLGTVFNRKQEALERLRELLELDPRVAPHLQNPDTRHGGSQQ